MLHKARTNLEVSLPWTGLDALVLEVSGPHPGLGADDRQQRMGRAQDALLWVLWAAPTPCIPVPGAQQSQPSPHCCACSLTR